MIEAQKEQLAEQILTMYQETYAGEYSITDPKLVVTRTEGKRADCLFAANWIMTYKPMANPWIQGMYQAAENLTDESQKAYALDIADGRKTDEQIYQDGMDVIAEAVRSTFSEDTDNVSGTASPKGNDA